MKTIHSPAIYLAVLLSCIVFGFQAQAQNDLQKAQDMMAVYEYPKAIELYTKEFITTKDPAIVPLRNLATCYMMVNNTKLAMETMSRIVKNNGATAEDVLTYASLLKTEGLYDDAIKQYERYNSMVPDKEESTNLLILACENSKKWLAKPEFIDISNMSVVNTENSDFGLVPVYKGYLLASDRKIRGDDAVYGWTGNPYLKLYYIQADDQQIPTGQFKPENDLNYKYHNGPGIFDENDGVVYYTRTEMVRVKKKPINPDPTSWHDYSTAADYTNRLEIYSAKYRNGNWYNVKAFAYNKPEEYSVGHPAINAVGTIMYFVSDMPGGFGESDIYYSLKRDDGSWSQPRNAGNVINTPGKEVFPFLDNDGTLYFSSDGHPGMGGLDIFYAKGSKDQWSLPENLKSPINSPKDDFSIYYTETGKSGYFSSNRDGGKGSDDIYSFVASPPVNLILLVVTKEKFDDNTTAVLDDVHLEIKNTSDDNPLPFINGLPGTFLATAKCSGAYEVSGTHEGYFASMQAVNMPYCISKQDTFVVELLLTKFIVGEHIALENIYYDFDKWFIRADAEPELNKLLKILVDNPNIKIELGSHTDSRGSDKYNEVLSQKRAEAAVNYIISMGVDKERITAKGYGEKELINNCADGVECSEEDHQLNRRTEFTVTGFIKGKGDVEIKSDKGTNIITHPKPK